MEEGTKTTDTYTTYDNTPIEERSKEWLRRHRNRYHVRARNVDKNGWISVHIKIKPSLWERLAVIRRRTGIEQTMQLNNLIEKALTQVENDAIRKDKISVAKKLKAQTLEYL